jgi:hypothetical protein
MNAGDDTELCVALCLAGWRLRYDAPLHPGGAAPVGLRAAIDSLAARGG